MIKVVRDSALLESLEGDIVTNMDEAKAQKLVEKHRARVTYGAAQKNEIDFGWRVYFRSNDPRDDVLIEALRVGDMTISGDPIAYWHEAGRGKTLVEAVEKAARKESWE